VAGLRVFAFVVTVICAGAGWAGAPDPVLAATTQFRQQNPGATIVGAKLEEEPAGYAVVEIRYRRGDDPSVAVDDCFLKRTDSGWLLEGCNADDC